SSSMAGVDEPYCILCTHFIPKEDWMMIPRVYPLGALQVKLSLEVYYHQLLSKDDGTQWESAGDNIMNYPEETRRSAHETKQAFRYWQETTLSQNGSPDYLEGL
ncbi:MAG: hypothetical protein MIO90_00700, partial [Methanomassiliicoccales archaeon]|nr:hypothetical protein [Methanomassiliicoccales archaeon]